MDNLKLVDALRKALSEIKNKVFKQDVFVFLDPPKTDNVPKVSVRDLINDEDIPF